MPAEHVRVSCDDSHCAVSGTLDFASASTAATALAGHVRSRDGLTIDLQGVESANSAGLAVLIECLAEARRAGHTVHFRGVPDSLRQLARVCQVDGLI